MADSNTAINDRLDDAIFSQISEVIGASEESPKDQPKSETDEEFDTTEDEADGEEAEDSEDDNPDGDERSELGDGSDSELEQAEAGTGDEPEQVSESLSVEVDGEKFTAESIRGLRDKARDLQSGFTQKYQEVAKQRKEVEQHNEQALQTLQFLESRLKAPLAKYEQVNWQELQATNPAQYQQLSAEYRSALQGHQQVSNGLKAYQDKVKQGADEDFKRRAAEAKSILEETNPDWSNDLYRDVMNYATELGAPVEEITSEIRPWVINLALKAMRADKGKIQAVPKTQSVKRTLKQKASAPVNPQHTKIKKAKQAAKRGDQKAKDFLFGNFLTESGLFED
jgi:hypothetical protein